MNVKDAFLIERDEYENLNALVKKVFFVDNHLPNRVFQKDYKHFFFLEFYSAMDETFWDNLKQLAKLTNDKFVLMAVLNPDPLSYYFKEFNYFNWTKLPIELSSDDYMNILNLAPDESPADSIIDNSYTIVWISPSMEWAIWGERDNGVCVIGFKNDTNVSEYLPYIPNWLTIDNMIVKEWVGLNYKDYKIPDDIAITLDSNYKN
ncbi:hypothetical protein PP175_06515 [Aneurinibacillus sp. Ricciae_BoGa-3]|uniref:hypothetical protein n=1 Tax=Aneurinibacillus sp. Ricciae_BoGa-3 TaxID=3022697 RepID=UPI00233FE9B0|nr:hypothetical protein [Aneurinibacillus sp. Ricciae_BoGa-3]WCK55593.1 hypothetical protein PP175_06515 [Aneurinibacillus sp. Ricciae_BoGa-3]